MAIAGHRARVMVSGAPVAFADEATTADPELTRFRVTDAAKGVFAPAAPVTVTRSANGTDPFAPVPAGEFRLDRLSGAVVFAAPQAPGTEVRVSGQHLALSEAAEAKEYSYTLTGNNADVSSFSEDGYTRRQQAQKDVSGSLSLWTTADRYFENALTAGEPVVLEFYSDRGAGPDLRAWALLNQDEMQAAVDGLLETSVEWEGSADADGRAVSLG